jgi:hypothetical protein
MVKILEKYNNNIVCFCYIIQADRSYLFFSVTYTGISIQDIANSANSTEPVMSFARDLEIFNFKNLEFHLIHI